MYPGDLARGCSDLEMTWLLCCAGATTVLRKEVAVWTKEVLVRHTIPLPALGPDFRNFVRFS